MQVACFGIISISGMQKSIEDVFLIELGSMNTKEVCARGKTQAHSSKNFQPFHQKKRLRYHKGKFCDSIPAGPSLLTSFECRTQASPTHNGDHQPLRPPSTRVVTTTSLYEGPSPTLGVRLSSDINNSTRTFVSKIQQMYYVKHRKFRRTLPSFSCVLIIDHKNKESKEKLC